MKHKIVGYLKKEKSVLLYLEAVSDEAPVTYGKCVTSCFVPLSRCPDLSALVGSFVELRLFKRDNCWRSDIKYLKEGV